MKIGKINFLIIINNNDDNNNDNNNNMNSNIRIQLIAIGRLEKVKLILLVMRTIAIGRLTKSNSNELKKIE